MKDHAISAASSITLYSKSNQEFGRVNIINWILSNLYKPICIGQYLWDGDSQKNLEAYVSEIVDESCGKLTTQEKKIKGYPRNRASKALSFRLLPSTKILLAHSLYNVVICLDLAESSFILTELGLPFKLFVNALEIILSKLLENLASTSIICNLHIIGFHPESNSTISVWRGELTEKSNIELVQHAVLEELTRIEEFSSQLNVTGYHFPSMDSFLEAMFVCGAQLSRECTKYILLTSGMMNVNVRDAVSFAAKHSMNLFLLVENMVSDRSVGFYQDLTSFQQLAISTGGSFELISPNQYKVDELIEIVESTCHHLIGDSFFSVPFVNRFSSGVSIFGEVLSEHLLHAYQLDGVTAEHLVISRLNGGFHLIYMEEQKDSTSSISSASATKFVSLRMEKLVSSSCLIQYEIGFQLALNKNKPLTIFAASRLRNYGDRGLSQKPTSASTDSGFDFSWTRGLMTIEIKEITVGISPALPTLEKSTALSQNIFELDKRLSNLLSLSQMPGCEEEPKHEKRPSSLYFRGSSNTEPTSSSELLPESVVPSCRILSGFSDLLDILTSFDSVHMRNYFLCDVDFSSVSDTFLATTSTIVDFSEILSQLQGQLSSIVGWSEFVALSKGKLLMVCKDAKFCPRGIAIVIIDIYETNRRLLQITVRKLATVACSLHRLCSEILKQCEICLKKYDAISLKYDVSPIVAAIDWYRPSYSIFATKSRRYDLPVTCSPFILLLIKEICCLKADSGFHLISVDNNNICATHAELSFASIVENCPSGIATEGLVHCRLALSRTNSHIHVIMTYSWIKSCHMDSCYLPIEASDIENLITSASSMDDSAFILYSEIFGVWNHLVLGNTTVTFTTPKVFSNDSWVLIKSLAVQSTQRLSWFEVNKELNQSLVDDMTKTFRSNSSLIEFTVAGPSSFEFSYFVASYHNNLVFIRLPTLVPESSCLEVEIYVLPVPTNSFRLPTINKSIISLPSKGLEGCCVHNETAFMKDLLKKSHNMSYSSLLYKALRSAHPVSLHDVEFALSTFSSVSFAVDISNMVKKRIVALECGHKHSKCSMQSSFVNSLGQCVVTVQHSLAFASQSIDPDIIQFASFSLVFQNSDFSLVTIPLTSNADGFVDELCKFCEELFAKRGSSIQICAELQVDVLFPNDGNDRSLSCLWMDDIIAAIKQFSAMDTLTSLLVSMSPHDNAVESVELAQHCLANLTGVTQYCAKYDFIGGKRDCDDASYVTKLFQLFESELRKLQPEFSAFVLSGDNKLSITKSWNYSSEGNIVGIPCWIFISFSTLTHVRRVILGDCSISVSQISLNITLKRIEAENVLVELSQADIVEDVNSLLLTCWYRVNKQILLAELRETQTASPCLLVPAVKTQSGSGSTVRTSRPPIPTHFTLPKLKGKIETGSNSAVTTPVVGEITPTVNNGKAIEIGCFTCERQAEVLCTVYSGTNISQDSMIRSLESLALSQFAVVNNDRYFVTQDSKGNVYYMTFDPPSDSSVSVREKDSKFVRLGIYGVDTPDSQMLQELSIHLDHRVVEITARSVSSNLIRSGYSLGSFSTFFKMASPQKQAHLKFPLPSFVQDVPLFCSIARQFLVHSQVLHPAKYPEKKQSFTPVPSNEQDDMLPFSYDSVSLWSSQAVIEKFEPFASKQIKRQLTRKHHVVHDDVAADSFRPKECIILWPSTEFGFVYNNVGARPTGMTQRVGNLTKQIGQGLGLIELFPLPRSSTRKFGKGPVDLSSDRYDQIRHYLLTGDVQLSEMEQIKEYLNEGGSFSLFPESNVEYGTEVRNRSSTVSEFVSSEEDQILVSGPNSDMDICVNFSPTINMQLTALIDLVQACLEQSLIMYTIEQLHNILQSNSGSARIDEELRFQPLQSDVLKIIHDIFDLCSRTKVNALGVNVCELTHVTCCLPKPIAVNVHTSIVEHILSQFPGLETTMTSAAGENSGVRSSTSRIAPHWCSLLPNSSDKNVTSTFFGRHWLSFKNNAADLTQSPSKNSQAQSKTKQEDLTILSDSEVPSYSLQFDGLKNRRYFIEICINTAGVHLFLFNISLTPQLSLRSVCREMTFKALQSLSNRNEEKLGLLGIPRRSVNIVDSITKMRPASVETMNKGIASLCWERRTLDRLDQSICQISDQFGVRGETGKGQSCNSSWLQSIVKTRWENGHLLEMFTVKLNAAEGLLNNCFDEYAKNFHSLFSSFEGELIKLSSDKCLIVVTVPRVSELLVVEMSLNSIERVAIVVIKSVTSTELIALEISHNDQLPNSRSVLSAIIGQVIAAQSAAIPRNFYSSLIQETRPICHDVPLLQSTASEFIQVILKDSFQDFLKILLSGKLTRTGDILPFIRSTVKMKLPFGIFVSEYSLPISSNPSPDYFSVTPDANSLIQAVFSNEKASIDFLSLPDDSNLAVFVFESGAEDGCQTGSTLPSTWGVVVLHDNGQAVGSDKLGVLVVTIASSSICLRNLIGNESKLKHLHLSTSSRVNHEKHYSSPLDILHFLLMNKIVDMCHAAAAQYSSQCIWKLICSEGGTVDKELKLKLYHQVCSESKRFELQKGIEFAIKEHSLVASLSQVFGNQFAVFEKFSAQRMVIFGPSESNFAVEVWMSDNFLQLGITRKSNFGATGEEDFILDQILSIVYLLLSTSS